MRRISPFNWITGQKKAFLVFLVLTLVTMAAMAFFDTRLKNEVTPNGIISYEFAGTLERAQAILQSWGNEGKIYAGLSLGLDYLFLFLYATTIGLGLTIIAEKINPVSFFGEFAGHLLARGIVIAAILDAVENYALIQLLLNSTNELFARLAKICATVKFSLVAIGLLYLIIASIFLLLPRKK